MPARTVATASVETREERIEAIMKELRPKIDEHQVIIGTAGDDAISMFG